MEIVVGNRPTVLEHNRAQCPGCGEWFVGIRGLRSHMSGKFVSMDCRSFKKKEQ